MLAAASEQSIEQAAELLRTGALVAFPTETVYGLGADATSLMAIERLFAVKGRARNNPLIIHLAEPEHMAELAVVTPEAVVLGQAWWPGPLTIVLRHRPGSPVTTAARAGLDTIALRMPSHPIARALLRKVGRPIAAASANRSGMISATSPAHVIDGFAGQPGAISLVLAGGRSPIGLESTVVDLSETPAKILRPGSIGLEELERYVHPIVEHRPGSSLTPRAPGQLGRHYAPSRPLRLSARSALPGEGLLTFGPDFFIQGGTQKLNLSPAGDLYEAASNLYDMMHALDCPPQSALAVVEIPSHGIGIAINDRLRRAVHVVMPAS